MKTWFTLAECATDGIWGGYLDPDGTHHETAVDALADMLNFCGCGRPEDALEYVGGGLRLIRDRDQYDGYEEWHYHVRALHGYKGGDYFFWYWCDHLGLTEHGGSVPGWLAGKGEALLADIERALKEHNT